MDNFNFSCTKCGKCCSSPPRVNFFETLELSDKFIFQAAHHSMISYAKNPLDKQLLEHYQNIGNTIMLPEIEASIFYFIDFVTIQLNSYNSCSQLENKLCNVYGSRPNSCKTSPINSFYSEKNQNKVIEFFKNEALNKNWECSFSDSEPLILKDNLIYNKNINFIYHSECSNIRLITDKYVEFLSLYGGERKNDHFKCLFNFLNKNELLITDMISILQMAIYFNIIDSNLAKNFVKNQLNLCEIELNKSIQLKNKLDLKANRFYKKLIEDYKKIIKIDFFNVEKSLDFGVI